MTQKTIEKFNQDISDLKKEVRTLRSFLIGALAKDPEGEYRPEFIKRIFQLSKEKTSFTFKNAKSFLKEIQKSS